MSDKERIKELERENERLKEENEQLRREKEELERGIEEIIWLYFNGFPKSLGVRRYK